ncbi:uncharacterized protein LOC109794164 [Cajanus cajan]|uniref:uncharacterized protein LOC109794164 n=1 Tax=Cajanus cajan TaxID=3821 RepID=UPI00098DCE95|nr:uncharacterized protein LOC109794164 [Cajanus cajan]
MRKSTRRLIFPQKEDELLISAGQVESLLRNGAECCLLIVALSVETERVLADIEVVRDFTEVFPDEVPGLPPVRELEFSIDLVPGAGPVLVAPYRMAPAELVELKVQLEDLLEKQLVRPSVSPWGALVLLVKKKDGGSRLCVDYRQLNNSSFLGTQQAKKSHQLLILQLFESNLPQELISYGNCPTTNAILS